MVHGETVMIKFGFFGIGLALVLWAINYVLSTFDPPSTVEDQTPNSAPILNEANPKEVS